MVFSEKKMSFKVGKKCRFELAEFTFSNSNSNSCSLSLLLCSFFKIYE